MNIPYINNTAQLSFQGRRQKPESSTSTNPNRKTMDGLLAGALLALAVLTSPMVETKAANKEHNKEPIEVKGNITPKFCQGSDVGNCVGVSILHSFARYNDGLDYLNSLVKKNDKGDFIVSFPNKKPIWISKNIISKYDAVTGNDFAEAITFALYKDAGNLDDAGNMKQGEKTNPARISLNERSTFQRLTGMEPNCCNGSLKDMQRIGEALQAGRKLLMATSFIKGVEKVSNNRLFDGHEFTIADVDIKNNKVVITNPWYDDESKIIKISIDDFQKYNSGMNILEMKTDGGKISFAEPGIGTKPGEVDYDVYFDIINYKPDAADFEEYFSQPQYKKGESNEFTTSFWYDFDKSGYEYYDKKESKRLSDSEIAEHMPTYSMLRKEGYTPISLVKQYMKNGTVPEFKNKKLQGQTEGIQNWLEEHSQYITYDIQNKHYKNIQAQKRAELDAIKKAQEDSIKAELRKQEDSIKIAKAEELRKLELRNQAVIENLKNQTFNSRPDSCEKGVFPNDLATYKEIYTGYKILPDNKGNKILKVPSGWRNDELLTLKFDKNNRILSKICTNTAGKTLDSEIYKYSDDGSRMIYKKGPFGDYTEQEVFDSKGNLTATNIYYEKDNASKRINYTMSPSGRLLRKSEIHQEIVKHQEYGLYTTWDSEYDYEFSPDGEVKKEIEYIMDTKAGKRAVRDKRTREYCDDGSVKDYWNDELKAVEINHDIYDVNGNKITGSYILKDLPSKQE